MIKSQSGETMGGVTVSAKGDGATITTAVFTDASGAYYFPPLPAGTYRVSAQALTFDTARADVALNANGRQDFTLRPLANFVRQLPGDVLLAALPQTTPEDAKHAAHRAQQLHRLPQRELCAAAPLRRRRLAQGHRHHEEHQRRRRRPARRQAARPTACSTPTRTRSPPISRAPADRAKAR